MPSLNVKYCCYGVPGEARTLNEGVGGPCFIQLDYGYIMFRGGKPPRAVFNLLKHICRSIAVICYFTYCEIMFKIIFTVFSMHGTGINSVRACAFSPPVAILGQGRPINDRLLPSVPPRFGSIFGSTPYRRMASAAMSTMCMTVSITRAQL